jgi:hypothetical protein
MYRGAVLLLLSLGAKTGLIQRLTNLLFLLICVPVILVSLLVLEAKIHPSFWDPLYNYGGVANVLPENK